MDASKAANMQPHKGHFGKNRPPVVSPEAWEAARQEMLEKEKALTRARDALAAERRRMPWMAVEKKYEFDGPKGGKSRASRCDCHSSILTEMKSQQLRQT